MQPLSSDVNPLTYHCALLSIIFFFLQLNGVTSLM